MKTVFYLSDYHPFADGLRDDSAAFRACFRDAAAAGHAQVVIEPGSYLLEHTQPIPLSSHLTVTAKGAELWFPRNLGEQVHRVLFAGENLTDFNWEGGCFRGYGYRPDREDNPWPPHACTRAIVLTRTKDGASRNLRFERIHGSEVAGSVLAVLGTVEDGQRFPAENVDVRDCCLEDCGKFMWDYGFLWQRLTFADQYTRQEVLEAERHMPLQWTAGPLSVGREELLCLDPASPSMEGVEDVSLFGRRDPVCGRVLYAHPAPDGRHFCLLEGRNPAAPAVDPRRAMGLRMFRGLHRCFQVLYAPVGAGPGKGGLDLSVCDHVTVSGCRLRAVGDTMHIYHSYDVCFSGNQITGSRMGAFFIAEYCRNVTVTGNTVDGTNGSRVMSVERSATDVTIVGNTFRGGGRGSWINQPTNLILSDNLFLCNTNKATPDLRVGRVTPITGDFERYPEIYFTTWQPGASYGPVILRSNIIQTGPRCTAAVAFNAGGRDLVMESNVLLGENRRIFVDPNCEMPHMSGNVGMEQVLHQLRQDNFDQRKL